MRGRDHGPGRFSCHVVPIDPCYELVGTAHDVARFDGGQEAQAAIDEFFATVEAAQRPAPPRPREATP